jgi:hypothetical protein
LVTNPGAYRNYQSRTSINYGTQLLRGIQLTGTKRYRNACSIIFAKNIHTPIANELLIAAGLIVSLPVVDVALSSGLFSFTTGAISSNFSLGFSDA